MSALKQFGDTIGEFLELKKYPEAVLVEPISEGKWSIREIVGHLLYWDKFNLETMVPLLAEGVKLPAFPNHDLHNEQAVSYLSRYENVEEIIDDFVKTRKMLVKELTEISKGLTFEIENEPYNFSPEKFVEIFLEHDAHHLKQIREKIKYRKFKIEEIPDYSPEIGQLVSMMNYARLTTLNAIKGLTIEQLDYLPYRDSNSIGALLLHMAAVEFGFQVELFDKRKPNKHESEEWGAAYQLGDLGRNQIKGNPLEFYIEKLEKVRSRTLEEFKKRSDEWLYEEVLWGNNLSNNYFIWFHTFEDEINHRGQIRILRKMLPHS